MAVAQQDAWNDGGLTMEPILLVHGYSAESAQNDLADVVRIFGQLPDGLKQVFPPPPVLDVNISRYISRDDGVDLEDITLAFDRGLKHNFSQLHSGGFNAIIHSTGALVLNRIRRCSPKPSRAGESSTWPGANLGGLGPHRRTLLARVAALYRRRRCRAGLGGARRVELGSNWAWELQPPFSAARQRYAWRTTRLWSFDRRQPATARKHDSPVTGTWRSSSVVRVAASNLNHHYLRIGPALPPENVDWERAVEFSRRTVDASAAGDLADFPSPDAVFAGNYYTLLEENLTSEQPIHAAAQAAAPRPVVPFAIPYSCAHSTEEMGIVSGTRPREKVLELIRDALTCPRRRGLRGPGGEIQATYRRNLHKGRRREPHWRFA
jgi:hypothetical protein